MASLKTCDLGAVFPTSGADGMKLYALPAWHPMRWIFIKRALLMMDLFRHIPRPQHLMEMGFGCGILAPELVGRAERYTGIDIHDHVEDIRAALRPQMGELDLRYGDARKLPFADDTFDCIFSMSVLEHISPIDAALDEIRRVLRPGGWLVVGFPIENLGSNFILDLVKGIIGFDRRIHHPTNHHAIIAGLNRTLVPVRQRPYPVPISITFSLFYTGIWQKSER
ncbi:MAG: class I SAM-dependent methyltransferase [Magnetococcus sp. WYHC-3]